MLDRPLVAGVLVGGRSQRMGRPKAVLPVGAVPLAERVVRALAAHTDDVVLLGDGPVPPALAALPRLADAPDAAGPVAALLAALAHRPDATWLVAACDLPHLSPDALAWLLAQRAPGAAAVLPRTPDGRVQPLTALYAAECRPHLLALARGPRPGPTRLVGRPGVLVPAVPSALAGAFRDVDTPEDVAALDLTASGDHPPR